MRLNMEYTSTDGMIRGSFAHSPDAMPLPLQAKSLNDFAKEVFSHHNRSIGLLPPALRYLSPNGRIAVFERPPGKYFVEQIMSARDDIEHLSKRDLSVYTKTYELSLPWTVYVCVFDLQYEPTNVWLYARNEPLHNLKDPLRLLPILNFYADGSLCPPIFNKFESIENPSVASGFQQTFNMVWNSGFNLDLREAYTCGPHDNIFKTPPRRAATNQYDSFFTKWSELTPKESLEVEWPMVRMGKNAGHNKLPKFTLTNAISNAHDHLSASTDQGVTEMMVYLTNIF